MASASSPCVQAGMIFPSPSTSSSTGSTSSTNSVVFLCAPCGEAFLPMSAERRIILRSYQCAEHGHLRNVVTVGRQAHNPPMDFARLFAGFFQPVLFGSLAVFVLIGVVALRAPHRSPVLVVRKPYR